MFKLNDQEWAFLESMLAEVDNLPADERGTHFVYDCGGSNCKSKCGGSCQAACKSSCTSLFS